MKWHKYIQGVALVLAGIVTMSMKVVASINPVGLSILAGYDSQMHEYSNGVISSGTGEWVVLHYNPLTYIIGALLIIAGGFSIYTAYKEDNHAN